MQTPLGQFSALLFLPYFHDYTSLRCFFHTREPTFILTYRCLPIMGSERHSGGLSRSGSASRPFRRHSWGIYSVSEHIYIIIICIFTDFLYARNSTVVAVTPRLYTLYNDLMSQIYKYYLHGSITTDRIYICHYYIFTDFLYACNDSSHYTCSLV